MLVFSFDMLLSEDLLVELEGNFLRGDNVFRALLWPPSGGKSPNDDWVLKTSLGGWRSDKDWSTELNDDELEDFDAANWWAILCEFESPLTIVEKIIWFSLKTRIIWIYSNVSIQKEFVLVFVL